MRYIGAGGVRVSVIGLGTWQFGSREWGYGRDYAELEAAKIVDKALEAGINVFDTAEIYGPWRSESILGRALQERRDHAFIATKLFPVGLPFMTAGRARGSARRLRVERIDLYQQHWPSPMFPPGATMARFRQLMDSGLVTHAGVSNHDLRQWQACDQALGRPVLSNQVRFSLLHREPDRELVPWAQRNDRIVIAYSPLAQGAVSGRYRDRAPGNFRRFNSDFSDAARKRREPLALALQEIAANHGATPAQISLAWLVNKPNVVAIPGASDEKQVEENAAAADIILSGDEISRLDTLSA
ncbi:MAG TPA: aldo/keto reductase [Candidatus Dormibacteraeota bacterium]|nr:aldo/keto reductase [Candidatus Dormibacteraeota bacterium]